MTEQPAGQAGAGDVALPPSAAPVTPVALSESPKLPGAPTAHRETREQLGQTASPGRCQSLGGAWRAPVGLRCSLAGDDLPSSESGPLFLKWDSRTGSAVSGPRVPEVRPPPPPLPTVPAQQAVGPQAGVHGAWGTYKLGASPHAGPFPADAAPGPAALQGSCPPASGPARGPPCLPRWGGERWKVASSAWRGCLRLTGWNRSRDPISRPTSQKEDCDLGPGEQEGPSLPLRFRVDEQMLVSLLEAGWAAVGGMGPQPGRQSGCLNDA